MNCMMNGVSTVMVGGMVMQNSGILFVDVDTASSQVEGFLNEAVHTLCGHHFSVMSDARRFGIVLFGYIYACCVVKGSSPTEAAHRRGKEVRA